MKPISHSPFSLSHFRTLSFCLMHIQSSGIESRNVKYLIVCITTCVNVITKQTMLSSFDVAAGEKINCSTLTLQINS